MLSQQDLAKKAAAEAATNLVTDGMIVGLGTGSTARFAIEAIGKRVAEGLRVVCIPTSEGTAKQAREWGIPLSTLGEHPKIDLTIDGADEVERRTLYLVKGLGGALLHEKIVASATAQLLIMIDETKLVEHLGEHVPVPVEVVPFGWQATSEKLSALGAVAKLRRTADGNIFFTDSGHHILDCSFGVIDNPEKLQCDLDATVGVVEHGLFLGMTTLVLVGSADGVEVMRR